MKKFDRNVKISLLEELEHSIFEFEERISREESYYQILIYKDSLIDTLITSANSLEEIDQWEFEMQVLKAQIKQSQQELLFLKEDLNKQRRLYEVVKKDIC